MERLSSQRAIAWRCSDSRSLQSFLGYAITATTPDHSSLTVIRQRLPLDIHGAVFTFVLSIAKIEKLLQGKSAAIDSTLIETDAAMKSIVRRDTEVRSVHSLCVRVVASPMYARQAVRDVAGFGVCRR